MKLIPISSVRYTDPNIIREVKFQHTIIFAVVGLLLILCTLFNYLALFVSRLRIRQRELALRTVYGASGWSLFAMLSVEFFMSLIAALIPGAVLINILSPFFLKISRIQLELSAIYLESAIYVAGVIVVALTVFFFTIEIFHRRTLNIRSNKKILRRTSIVVQLTVSIVFAFCTLVIIKQMYYLHNTDLGFSFKNRSSMGVYLPFEELSLLAPLNDKIKQIPEIKETVSGYPSLLPTWEESTAPITDWDDKQGDDEEIYICDAGFSEEYAKFYDFKLIEGEFLRDDDGQKVFPQYTQEYVLIDESAAKAFGWNKAVGKSFWRGAHKRFVVKGVVKNIYKFSPTIASKPFYFHNQSHIASGILFKYEEGTLKICMEKIRKIVEKEFPDRFCAFSHMEEEYDKYLRSENALLAILTTVSFVCLIVCIFGFVSIVSLTCEERRKEIAIRKINGATIKD
jgi:hypothetical protein